jgi:type I thyroxine 5'-deiodinase
MRWTRGIRNGVAVGELAPDGQVIDLNGETAALSSYFGPEASTLLVLNFGAYSCPHQRKRIDELKALQSRWADKGVLFLFVYTAEAHPEDGWRLDHQYEHDPEYTGAEDFCFYYAKTLAERTAMARWLIEKKQLDMPLVLDAMDDKLLTAYNTWPIRLYIVRDGRVAYCGDQGPFGYEPADVDKALAQLSADG